MSYACLKSGHDLIQFWKTKNVDCFVAFIEENLEIIWGKFLNENCTLESLVDDWKVS